MRSILVITVLLISSFRFPEENDVLVWKEDRPLTWDDFRGKPAKRFAAASTTYDIWQSIPKHDDHSAVIKIQAVFLFDRSWKKESWINSSVLAHEQKHFDIAELYARKLRERTGKLKSHNYDELKQKTDSLYSVIDKEMDVYQDKYDDETDASMNGDKQREWNKKIMDEIHELNAYNSSEISVRFLR